MIDIFEWLARDLLEPKSFCCLVMSNIVGNDVIYSYWDLRVMTRSDVAKLVLL